MTIKLVKTFLNAHSRYYDFFGIAENVSGNDYSGVHIQCYGWRDCSEKPVMIALVKKNRPADFSLDDSDRVSEARLRNNYYNRFETDEVEIDD